MFDDLVESSVVRKKTNKSWSVIAMGIAQVVVIAVLILIPLIYTQSLPAAMMTTLIMAPPPPPPPPPPPAVQKVQIVKPVVRLMHNGELVAPRAIPKEVKMIKEEEMPPDVSSVGIEGGVPGGVEGGSSGGVMGGILGGIPSAAPPPPPKQTPQRIRLGGNVEQAKLISQPMPVYPQLARQARIQGTVVLHAIISKDGRIEELSVISGHPLLVQAAKDAVQQWRYQPTLLNGEPVEVDTTISVTFTMGG